MQLSHEQKRSFVEHGYVIIPGVVPRIMVDAALRAINHSLGEGMEPARMTTFRAQTYCPELTKTRTIFGLLTDTPGWALAESLTGAGKLHPCSSGQIALRFPNMSDQLGKPGPHIDGTYTPDNGVKQGTIDNFTMLASVMLSDVPGPYCGNFTVWPGTHHRFEAYFRQHGPQSLLQGMPKIDMPEPVQITARAGDLVLAHYQLAHGVAPNASPHVRYACFYRLSHVDHTKQKWEAMTNIWMEYEGLEESRNSEVGVRS